MNTPEISLLNDLSPTLDFNAAAWPRPALWCDPATGLVPQIADLLHRHALHPARVVVLVPYAQLMGFAREQWARCGPPGFVPRFETTRNWARSAGDFVPARDDLAFDLARDLLTAQSLLARAGLGAQQVALAGPLVDIAQQLAPLAAAVRPDERAAWAERATGAALGEGASASPWFAIETALAAIAVAWVSTSGYATDALLGGGAQAQTDALIVLDGLQADPLIESLGALFGARVFHLPLWRDEAPTSLAALHPAADAEDEAERAAACVLQHLAAGQAPVALVALDRALTRRIRARLAAHGVSLHDETGWKLSTTRAAATLMTALRACTHDASSDQLLDWLKGVPAIAPQALQRLEAQLRQRGLRDWATWRALATGSASTQDAALRGLTQEIEAWRAPLAASRPLADWLQATRTLLQANGQWPALHSDVAGVKVIEALYLEPGEAALLASLGGESGVPATPRRIALAEFTAWVRAVLESASFVLAPPLDGAPQVVVLPLHQLIGRPFGAVVMPGCDDQRLPASPELPGGWSTEQRAALGLPSREAVAAAQRAAWTVALHMPHCDLLWRQVDASGEPVRRSPLVQLLELAGGAADAADPRRPRELTATPTSPPQPHGDALPLEALSASAYEDLRRCPYRFFGLRQLGLRGADELDAELGKRDFGNWLHAVLGHFHQALKEAPTPDLPAQLAMISIAAERATQELALSEVEFLPFAAAWPAVRDGYLQWLAQYEAKEGAVFSEAEAWKEQPLGALRLIGRIDRIDQLPDGRALLIDYKTESLDTSRKRVKDPGEDTQLAFYAALLEDDTLRAAYVNVGEKSSGTSTVEQHDVVYARDALIAGVLDDFARIADGAPLPALGEGMVCEHCDARGLCRKDFWSDDAPRLATACALPEAAALPPVPGMAGLDLSEAIRFAEARGAGGDPTPAPALAPPPALPQAAYRHNGALVERVRFYEIACDPRRSVAVEACAGAGKTWMLVSRMVRALLETGEGACEPHEILAITFTKKAAGEMRARLDEWLEKFAHLSPDELLPELRMRGLDAASAHAAAARLQGLYRQGLEGGRPVQVRTFHGWFAGLLRHAPLAVLQRLDLPASYQLLEDDSEARQRVWRPFFAAVLADAQASDDYHALVATHGRSQTAKALDDALTRRVEFRLADEGGDVADQVAPFTRQYPECGGAPTPAAWLLADTELLWAAARALGRASAKTFAAKGGELEQALTEGQADGVQAALFTLAGEPRKFGEKIVGIEQVREAQQRVRLYLDAQAQHEAWLYQQRMTRLTRKLVAAFAQVKRQHGWVDMNDVEAAAHLLLSDPVLSGWLQERLDARVRHLLIDEFQDTNPMQWQALYGWLSGYAGAGGRAPSIFLVGDPKQSIYRFRRAEPQVFIAAQRFISDELGGDQLSCDHTHRNARAVIGLVNNVMQAAQQAGEFSDFRDHTTESSVAGATWALPPIEREAAGPEAASEDQAPAWRDSLTTPRLLPEERLLARECRQAAQWIAQRIADGLAPSRIMVLSRRRNRLAVMQDELRARHIAVQQPEKNKLGDAPEVQDLIALLDALISPAHDLSLARALKSPLFGVDDDGLVQLAVLQRRARAVQAEARAAAEVQAEAQAEAREASQAVSTESPDAHTAPVRRALPSWFELLQGPDLPAALAPLGPILLRWQRWADTLPPHDALAAMFHDGDVLARFAAAAPAALRQSTLANLRGLLAASLELDSARFATPYALVRALRAGSLRAPAVASTDAVQLLTVHGAKGLEAELVLLLDCDAPPSRAQTMGVLVVWPGEKKVPDRFVFVASEKRPSACVSDALLTEHAARHREEINALYVATTRARTQLVISSVAPATPQAQSWWARLAPGCEPLRLGVPEGASSAGAGLPGGHHFYMLEWPVTPIPRAQAAIKKIVDKAPDSRASALGQAMHRLLEWARPGVPLAAAQVQAVQREFMLGAADAREASAMAERIRAGAGAWTWDAQAVDWQGNEVTLCHAGQTLRIDRLVRHRDSAVWWVLDYKSAARPERDPALIAQLNFYCVAVQSAYPGDTVRAAFLTGQGELVSLE